MTKPAFPCRAPNKQAGTGTRSKIVWEIYRAVNNLRQQAALCSFPGDEHLGGKLIFSARASWGNFPGLSFWRVIWVIFIDVYYTALKSMRGNFFLSVSGGRAADDYRLWEWGQPVWHGRSLLWGEVSDVSNLLSIAHPLFFFFFFWGVGGSCQGVLPMGPRC